MQNDFEKDITQRLQNFSLVPQPEIWQRVEAALPPEKKRPLVFWWLLLLPVLAGMAIWIVAKHETSEIQQPIVPNGPVTQLSQADTATLQQPPLTQTTASNADTVAPAPSINYTTQSQLPLPRSKALPDSNKTAENIQHKTNSTVTLQNVAPLQKTDRQHAQKSVLRRLYRSNTQLATVPAAPVAGINSQLKKLPTDITDTADVNDSTDSVRHTVLTTRPVKAVSLTPTTQLASDRVKTIGSAIVDSAKNNQATDQNSLVGHSLPARPAGNKQQAVWRLYFGAGKSLLYSDNYQFVGPVFSSYNPTANSSFVNSFLAAKSGLSLGIGLTCRMYFSPHWSWQLSARYQYVSATQPVGADTGSSLNVQQSWLTGISNRQRSSTHQLLLLPHLGYTIRVGQSFSVTPLAGAAGGWNVINHAVLSDYRINRYIRSAYYSNKWYAAVDAGLELSWKNRWSAGIFYQAPLSNVSKPDLQSDYRWEGWQMQVGIPLFRHSSK